MNNYPAPTACKTAVKTHSTRSGAQAAQSFPGFFPQDHPIYPNLTSNENILFWNNLHGLQAVTLKTPVEEAYIINSLAERQKAQEAQAARAVEQAVTAERTRLARDLHDAVTQTLFSASLIAEVLPEIWDMDQAEARKSTEELRQLTRGALAEMRTLLLELRPAALTQARFPDLLKQLCEALIGRARLPIRLDVKGDYEMPSDVKVAFYRIAQESLNNIIKYARATRVEIRIRLDDGNLQMEIEDDGVGFDPSSVKSTSLGMRIMHERAEAIHARLKITSQLEKGTKICLEWKEEG